MSQSPAEPLGGIYQAKEGDWDKLINQASLQVKQKMLRLFEIKSKELKNKVEKRRNKRKLNKKFKK